MEFDGIYRDATVYLNGVKLITKPYGYTSFSLDLTGGLKLGGSNTLAVRVDNSAQPNSRWYTGSGIYRHVRLVVTQPEHVAHWGVFITTPEVDRPDCCRKGCQTTLVAVARRSDGRDRLDNLFYDGKGIKCGHSVEGDDLAAGEAARSNANDRSPAPHALGTVITHPLPCSIAQVANGKHGR